MSWYQLDSILKEQVEYAQFYRQQWPMACPNDGVPLRTPPGTVAAAGIQLWCPHDGWQYPRDYDPNLHSGM